MLRSDSNTAAQLPLLGPEDPREGAAAPGTDGFVLAASAAESLISARSLKSHVSASVSPADCMRIYEL